eukprot:4934030-Prorocentrum_lima.AAC.1
MEPTIQQCMYVRDPEHKPVRVRADGSTRRKYPCKVELLPGDDDQPDQDFIGIEEEAPLTALKVQHQSKEA